MYGKVARRTVAVRGDRGTVQQLYADTDDRKNHTRPVEADPTVVKTLGTVLCSSRDGVPLNDISHNPYIVNHSTLPL